MSALWFGFNPPWIGSSTGVLSRQTDERLIKNDIVQLLLTIPGERTHRPNFGTRLRSMIFESLRDDDLVALSHDLKIAIEKYDDRVSVISINCSTTDGGLVLRVRVDFSIINRPLTKYFIELLVGQNGATLIK